MSKNHRTSPPPSPIDLAERLRRESRKLTGPRQAILRSLKDQRRPLTMREIHLAIGKGACDLATVYRAVHMLEKMGLVDRFDFGEGVARYQWVSSDPAEHHHHLICVRCSEIVEVGECFPREWEERIALGKGFKVLRHKLEFFGLCSSCQ